MHTQMDEIVARLVQRVENLYFGKYRGKVTANNDPDNLGRLKANVPRLLQDQETGWALPAFPYGGAKDQGFFAVPDIGAGVWIEFEGGDLSYPIWSGTWFTSQAIPESATPSKKVWKTKAGHKIVMDDSAGALEVTDSHGNTITMDSNTIKVAAGSASKIIINAPNIELEDRAPHPLVFGDNLLQYLNQLVQLYQTHVHPGETVFGIIPVTPAPPQPPLPPATPSLLSNKVKTG